MCSGNVWFVEAQGSKFISFDLVTISRPWATCLYQVKSFWWEYSSSTWTLDLKTNRCKKKKKVHNSIWWNANINVMYLNLFNGSTPFTEVNYQNIQHFEIAWHLTSESSAGWKEWSSWGVGILQVESGFRFRLGASAACINLWHQPTWLEENIGSWRRGQAITSIQIQHPSVSAHHSGTTSIPHFVVFHSTYINSQHPTE